MICVVIQGPTLQKVYQQLELAKAHADMIELRLDLWEEWSLQFIERIVHDYTVIVTLRAMSQGGNYTGAEEQRLGDLAALAALAPAYLDIEDSVPMDFIQKLRQAHPSLKLVLSHHNFNETPQDLTGLLKAMQAKCADFYKIAAEAKTTLDTLRLLHFIKEQQQNNLIGIAMGRLGELSRITGKLYGCPWTYASLDQDFAVVPGQLTASTLKNVYHDAALSKTTEYYGLIGHPVHKSIGTLSNNRVMEHFKLDAVYGRATILPEELPALFYYAKALDWKGLSVTMPLKEAIIPLLDHIDKIALDIRAVNTIVFKDQLAFGYNTDAIGSIKAIEEVILVEKKRVVVIGAGGACKAVVYMLVKQGAYVTVLNRNKERAKAIAYQFSCQSGDFDALENVCEKGYDLIINSTPSEMPINSKYILPNVAVMDLAAGDTEFLKVARSKNCSVIYGRRMFFHQAVAQFEYWYNQQLNSEEVLDVLAGSISD